MGHSRTTLACSDVTWPHKLTVLRPQLPEAASRTFYRCQKLLAALHLYYQVASSEAELPQPASRVACVLYYMCTTKCSSEATAKIATDQKPLPGRGLSWLPGASYKLPLLRDTLVGHSGGKLLYDTLVRQYCRTLFRDTLAEHFCRTLL